MVLVQHLLIRLTWVEYIILTCQLNIALMVIRYLLLRLKLLLFCLIKGCCRGARDLLRAYHRVVVLVCAGGYLRIFVDLFWVRVGADDSWVELTRLPLVLIINGRLLDWHASMGRECCMERWSSGTIFLLLVEFILRWWQLHHILTPIVDIRDLDKGTDVRRSVPGIFRRVYNLCFNLVGFKLRHLFHRRLELSLEILRQYFRPLELLAEPDIGHRCFLVDRLRWLEACHEHWFGLIAFC